MKMQAKALSLILAVLMCTGILAACTDGNVTVSDPAASNTVSDTVSKEEGFSYGPVDYGTFPYENESYDGSAAIRILCVEGERHKYGVQQFTYLEELEGNTINGAVQNRNNYLEEKYGITFDVTTAKFPGDEIKNLIAGNTDAYDLICESVDRLVVGIPENYYWSLNDYVNISHPWWDQRAINALSLGEKYYLLAGDALITDDDNTYLTLYNKDMYNKNATLTEKGDIYQIVRDGEFTIDLYYEMCRAVSSPDTNGQWGFNATYGNLSHAYGATVMVNGCNIATATKDASNTLNITLDDEASINAFNKVYELMSDSTNTQRAELIAGQSSTNPSQYGFAELEEMFVNQRGLFYNTTSSSVSILKSANVEFEFGVLPIPKLNKEQDYYCNTVNVYQSSALAIPSSVPAERIPQIAFALQAMGFYNADVIRAYYQTTLQLQAVQSDDDAEMLDIVYNNRFYDIGAIYNWGGKLLGFYGSIIGNANSNTIVSAWQGIESQVQTAMEQAVEAYNKATT